MQKEDMIIADELCAYYNIEISFVVSLSQNGLIEMTTIEEHHYIPVSSVQQLERIIRLHYELDINLEGIEAITSLLNRVENLQQEIVSLKNRVRLYES